MRPSRCSGQKTWVSRAPPARGKSRSRPLSAKHRRRSPDRVRRPPSRADPSAWRAIHPAVSQVAPPEGFHDRRLRGSFESRPVPYPRSTGRHVASRPAPQTAWRIRSGQAGLPSGGEHGTRPRSRPGAERRAPQGPETRAGSLPLAAVAAGLRLASVATCCRASQARYRVNWPASSGTQDRRRPKPQVPRAAAPSPLGGSRRSLVARPPARLPRIGQQATQAPGRACSRAGRRLVVARPFEEATLGANRRLSTSGAGIIGGDSDVCKLAANRCPPTRCRRLRPAQPKKPRIRG